MFMTKARANIGVVRISTDECYVLSNQAVSPIVLDSDGDGMKTAKVDAKDAAFANPKVWKDADGDGYTLAGELKSPSDLGVQAINLGDTTTNTTDAQGNSQARLSSFTKADGAVGHDGQHRSWFERDLT